MRKKEKLDMQGQAKNLFGSYSPEYQQLIEGINLVLQLSLSTMSPSLPSLDKAIPPVNTQSKIFSQAVKTTASALRYVIKRSFAAFLSSKLDWNASRMARTAPIRGSGLLVSSHSSHQSTEVTGIHHYHYHHHSYSHYHYPVPGGSRLSQRDEVSKKSQRDTSNRNARFRRASHIRRRMASSP